ncbi:MAG TPA: hypothetical protein VFC19_40715 [Candidatus Limnocylindrales bacterium]|nr:hypothetical protein [Candidatus Limnocylindrales bacterium]
MQHKDTAHAEQAGGRLDAWLVVGRVGVDDDHVVDPVREAVEHVQGAAGDDAGP